MGIGAFFTEASDHLVDWTRVGNLFFSQNGHSYSNRELAQRGFIAAFTGIAGYLGWSLTNDPTYAATALGLGLLASHAIVISPLVYKRLETKRACKRLITDIKEQVAESELATLVEPVIEKITNYAEGKSASAIWGARKRLLTHFLGWVTDPTVSIDELAAVLKRADVILCLSNQNFQDTGTDLADVPGLG